MIDSLPKSLSARELVAVFKADPDRRFSEAEAVVLTAAACGDGWAAKAAALHHFRNRDFDIALTLMRGVMEKEPSAENAKNVAVTLRNLNRCQEGVEWMERFKSVFD